jgi:hypothetical protein
LRGIRTLNEVFEWQAGYHIPAGRLDSMIDRAVKRLPGLFYIDSAECKSATTTEAICQLRLLSFRDRRERRV